MTERIYLDHAATTPLRPEVREAVLPFLTAGGSGNPSSLHADGQRAKRVLDAARSTVAEALHVEFGEVTFTSGGTEADNAAIVGIMLGNRERGHHMVTTAIEHEAVLRSCRFLETLGVEVTYVIPDADGLVSPSDVRAAVTDRTVLVSVMHANNEVGAIQPITEIAEIAHDHGALFHTDAVQSFGQVDVHADVVGADLISISGHKIYGPKGAGALYVRSGVSIEPLMHGGSQERERRAGTENVAGIAGFARAVELAEDERHQWTARITPLRNRLAAAILRDVKGAVLNGPPLDSASPSPFHGEDRGGAYTLRRLPNNINISFPGLDAQSLLLALDMAGISASSGSACTSGSIEPSHVLTAMGQVDARVRSALRLTLGRDTTEVEVDRAAGIVVETAIRLSKQAT